MVEPTAVAAAAAPRARSGDRSSLAGTSLGPLVSASVNWSVGVPQERPGKRLELV